MRLNGWQRIGVVVSVVWMIGGTIWGVGFIGEHSATALSTYKLCLADHDALGAPDLATCSANYQRELPFLGKGTRLSALALKSVSSFIATGSMFLWDKSISALGTGLFPCLRFSN